MLIVHPYVPGHREDDQAATWRLIAEVARRWPVHDVDLSWDPLHGYGSTLRALWDGDRDWLIIEHDVEATVGDVEAMDGCPEMMCTAPYPHSGRPAEDLTGRQVVACSLGFTRITARARRLCGGWPVPDGVTYHLLDTYLSSALVTRTGTTWHPHRPVAHHHG